ncbi:MAG: NAD(P)/FAD-dependent oxidoreductase [Alphaproteobacteria bacterium]|nr:NAD(P)/FAD-dependent oxidoreductase [Alphaproteobacteria bacterium]MBU1563322.1 NAD(P)/FAD-dependent oxidoreductase [Alphaproteobacteria bacterium]MBU2302045.1 NAD(P)/FAD-dependent oxidoreductase [Alphaproteobacteria bacterium]MBU2367301.1 NAD(P)/FAD-dependent oxidoreductase [Alphaproteobacteria bacterium]
MARHRVVIVGSGFGGLSAAQALAGADVDVTLIDRRNHHLFQPLLYQVATASLGTSEIAWPIRHILRRRSEVTTLLATVTGVDVAGKAVLLEDGSRVGYDSLILATGARHAYFGHDDWEKFAPGLKTLEDATTIRRKLLLAFEAAEREPDPDKRQALLTFVIIGAGPTGVELAGAIVELARVTLTGEFRRADPGKARVVLIEAGNKVLANFQPGLSDYTLKSLRDLGVEVILGKPVTTIDADGLVYGDTRLDAECIIWAAGVEASPAAKWLGLEPDRAGRVKVTADLSVPEHGEIFVVGDTASITMPDGKPVPGVGDAAKQGGKHAASVIRARLAGDTALKPFRYKHAGDLATIGKRAAVIDFGWIRLKGWVAWWVWGIAHIYFLIDTKNRLAVALSWLWIYLSGQRSARLITQGEAEAKAPIKEVTEA